MISPNPLILHDELLLTQGSSRFIYRHPCNSEWLIKVLRPEYIERKSGANAPWYKRLRRLGSFVGFEREMREQLKAYLHYGEHPTYLYFIAGMQPTDRGLGQVVEAVRGRDGKYAPTLRTIIREGRYDADAARSLEQFFTWLYDSPIVISDLTLDNLVYRYSAVNGDHFCLIDGVGEPNQIPLKSTFAWWNRLSKSRWIAEFKRRIVLHQAG